MPELPLAELEVGLQDDGNVKIRGNLVDLRVEAHEEGDASRRPGCLEVVHPAGVRLECLDDQSLE